MYIQYCFLLPPTHCFRLLVRWLLKAKLDLSEFIDLAFANQRRGTHLEEERTKCCVKLSKNGSKLKRMMTW